MPNFQNTFMVAPSWFGHRNQGNSTSQDGGWSNAQRRGMDCGPGFVPKGHSSVELGAPYICGYYHDLGFPYHIEVWNRSEKDSNICASSLCGNQHQPCSTCPFKKSLSHYNIYNHDNYVDYISKKDLGVILEHVMNQIKDLEK